MSKNRMAKAISHRGRIIAHIGPFEKGQMTVRNPHVVDFAIKAWLNALRSAGITQILLDEEPAVAPAPLKAEGRKKKRGPPMSRPQEERLAIVDEWGVTEEKKKDFCHRHRISPSTLDRWVRAARADLLRDLP